MAAEGITAFGNLRCCTNNGDIISGISCHLINVRRLSIPSVVYGCENTELFVKQEASSLKGLFENTRN